MHLYNFPIRKLKSTYERAITKIVDLYSKQESVTSIFQIGSVADPGISDIDLIIVFKKNFTNSIKPLDALNPEERYLFTHNVFGINDEHFKEGLQYNIHHDYKLLWGENLNEKVYLQPEDRKLLEKQIALEFLLSNLVARTIEKKYGLLSVRNILLSVKALIYDLNYLNSEVNHNQLSSLESNIDQLILLRKTWFEEKNNKVRFLKWYYDFSSNLTKTLPIIFSDYLIEYFGEGDFNYGNNVKISLGKTFNVRTFGISIPSRISALHKKIRNANKYLTGFTFSFPGVETKNTFQIERYLYNKKVIHYNKSYINPILPLINPYFSNYFKHV